MELYRRMNSKVRSYRILLLTGYNGIGKTTFLNYSIDTNPSMDLLLYRLSWK